MRHEGSKRVRTALLVAGIVVSLLLWKIVGLALDLQGISPYGQVAGEKNGSELNFFESPWFYGVCVLGVILAGVGLHYLRVQRLKAQEEELLRLVSECTEKLKQEVAEHKRIEEALRQEQYLLRTLLDNLPDAI